MKNISSTAPQTEILREIYYILAYLTENITSSNSDSSVNQKNIYAKLDEIKTKISDISTGSQTINNNYYYKYIRNVQHNYIIQEEKYYNQPDPRWLAIIGSTPEPSLIPKYQESGVTRASLNPDYIQGQPARIFYKNYFCKNK